MSNDKKCPSCKNPMTVNDFVSCQNKKCLEFDQKYLPYEFNIFLSELAELELMEKEGEL
jgi:aspartate carbamoyltransferase regulatory subunit